MRAFVFAVTFLVYAPCCVVLTADLAGHRSDPLVWHGLVGIVWGLGMASAISRRPNL